MSSPTTSDKDFTGCQAKSLRVHNITDVTDVPSEGQVDGALYYFSPTGDKRLAVWDTQAGTLVKLPRTDRGAAAGQSWTVAQTFDSVDLLMSAGKGLSWDGSTEFVRRGAAADTIEIGTGNTVWLTVGAAGSINLPALVASKIVRTDGSKNLAEVTIGANLTFDGTTLAAVGGGSGTVTSVSLTAPSQFSVTGSPVTTSGTIDVAWNTQTANRVLAGPTSGGAAVPTFRSLVSGDVPDLGANPTATVGLSATNGSGTSYMRANAAPALDQNINPDWGGTHRFSNRVSFNFGTETLSADNQIISLPTLYKRLDSDNATASNRTFGLPNTPPAGTVVIIEWVGTNAGELIDDANVGAGSATTRLAGNWTPTQYDTITLIFNGTDWIEVCRSTN